MIRRLACKASTSFTQPDGSGRRYGQVLWSCDTPEGPAGLAWDWFELRPRIVALADPMSILSNLEFADAAGRPLSRAQRVIELNNLIACLPWQEQVVPRAVPPRVELPLAA